MSFKEKYNGLYPIVPKFTSMENKFGKLYFEGKFLEKFDPWKIFDDESPDYDSRFFETTESSTGYGAYFHVMLNYPIRDISLIRVKHGSNTSYLTKGVEIFALLDDGTMQRLGAWLIPGTKEYQLVDVSTKTPAFITKHLVFRFTTGYHILNEIQFYSKYPVGVNSVLLEINSAMYSTAKSSVELVESGNNPSKQSFDKGSDISEVIGQMDLIKAISDKFKVHILD